MGIGPRSRPTAKQCFRKGMIFVLFIYHALSILIQYLRVNPDIDLTTIQKFLFDHWKLFEPKLIISIIGGAREYILDDRLEAKFVNGIVNVAVRSGTENQICFQPFTQSLT